MEKENTASYLGKSVEEIQHKITIKSAVFSKKTVTKKTCPVLIKTLSHTGELRTETLKTTVTSENREHEMFLNREETD